MNTQTIEIMNRHYTLQCRCAKCGAWQAVKISELAQGHKNCRVGRLGKAPCIGTVELNPSQNREDAIHEAMMLLGYLNLIQAAGKDTPLAEILDTIVDDVGCWSESAATPQEMGWVDYRGLP